MGMGSYQRRPRYQQENAMDNANVLTQLLQQKGKALDGVTNAVDQYGQSRVRNDVSELMGTEAFMNMNPAEAQAAIAGQTGGRDLGENFMKTLLMSNKNKGDVQGNTWDENAATTLFGRQMSKQAQGHANSVALSSMNNKARQKLYGTKAGDISGTNSAENRRIYLEEIAKTNDPKLKNKLAQEGFLNDLFSKDDRIALEKLGIVNLASPSTSGGKKKGGFYVRGGGSDMNSYGSSNTAQQRGWTEQKDKDGKTIRVDIPSGMVIGPEFLTALKAGKI